MLYIERVESSLKKGCDVNLGPKTVICGPNGSGKSTVIQSAELAANGWVSDMEGRARVKQHTALARLFPPDVAKHTRIVLSDGTVFSWEMENGSKPGSFKTPEHRAPFSLQWPVQDLTTTLRGDASTVGSWLEKQVVGKITEEDLLSALPPAHRDIVKDVIKRKRKTDFLALAKDIKQEAKNLRSAATRTENTIERMVEGIAPPMMESVREKLEAKLAALASPQEGVTQVEYDAARKELEKLAESYAAKETEYKALLPLPEAVVNGLSQLTTAGELIKQHLQVFGKDECWVCGNEDPAAMDAQSARLANAMAALQPQYLEGMKRQQVARELSSLMNSLETKTAAFKALVVAETVDTTERDTIISRLASDDAAKKTWANAEASRKEVDQSRARADVMNLAGSALEKAGKRHLASAKVAFEKKVSAFLPEGEELGIDLKSSRIGLMRDGELHSALSGAEWSRVLLALGGVEWADSKVPCVLVPDDRAWDGDTLKSVMEALVDAPVQVIIMSTVEPDPVEGWTCLNLQ